MQGPDAAIDSVSRLPSLAKTASLQSLPAQEQQADGLPSGGQATTHPVQPAPATKHHPAQPATTSNGGPEDAGSQVDHTEAG